jgi:hypothetical protein
MRIAKPSFVLTAAITVCASLDRCRAEDCTSLAKLNLPASQITVAHMVPAGDFTPPRGKTMSVKAAFCRLAAVSTPAPDSQIDFEVWLQ